MSAYGRTMREWVLAARPKTLGAAIIPVLVGSAIAWSIANSSAVQAPGLFHPWLSFVAGLCAICIQIGTNFFNDVLDFKKGADTRERFGPTRITAAGIASPRAVTVAAILVYTVAMILGAILVAHAGVPILVIGVCSLIAGYVYTGGPYPLAYRGMGDIFVMLFFGIIAVGGTVYLQLRIWPSQALVAGIQVGALAVVLIAINNLRDLSGDTKAGKRTLAVRLGPALAARYIVAVITLPYIFSLFWILDRELLAGLLPLISLPLAYSLAKSVLLTPPSAAMNGLLARAGLLQLVFGLMLGVGLVVR